MFKNNWIFMGPLKSTPIENGFWETLPPLSPTQRDFSIPAATEVFQQHSELKCESDNFYTSCDDSTSKPGEEPSDRKGGEHKRVRREPLIANSVKLHLTSLFEAIPKEASPPQSQKTSLQSDLKPFNCNEPGCSACYPSTSSLQKHIKMKHSPKQHECNVCLEKFSLPRELKRHVQRIHNPDKALTCEKCKRVFGDVWALKQHYFSTHPNNKPFACPRCYASYSTKNSLSHHVIQKHTILDFICQICSKAFAGQAYLNQHHREVHLKQPRKDMEAYKRKLEAQKRSFDNSTSVLDENSSIHYDLSSKRS